MGDTQSYPPEDGITHVEFQVTNPEYPFVGASLDGGQVYLEEIIPRGDRGYGEFYSVHGVSHDTIMERADAHESVDAELLVEHDHGKLYEFVVFAESCPAVYLGEQGALPREVESANGDGRIAAEIPPTIDASTVIEQFLEAHPDAELLAKHQQPHQTPLFTHRELAQGVEERLTDRQQEVLTVAHENGYYDWPREVSGEDLAAELGIAPPTFYEHLRAAEQTLISIVFQTTPTNETTDA